MNKHLPSCKSTLGHDAWERDFVPKIRDAKGRGEHVMLIPVLKNAASEFHDKASKHKAKAEKEEKEAQAKRYAEKRGANGKYVVILETLPLARWRR